MNEKQIGEAIKKKRKELKWTQNDLAEKTGLVYQTISNIERGEKATFTTILKICKILGLTLIVADEAITIE